MKSNIAYEYSCCFVNMNTKVIDSTVILHTAYNEYSGLFTVITK